MRAKWGEKKQFAVCKMAELRLGGSKMTARERTDHSTLALGSSKTPLSHLSEQSTCSEVCGKKLREKR